MSGSGKDILALLRRVEAQGAEVTMAKSGHWRVFNPQTNQSCQIAQTPRHQRYIYNAATRLKRIGLLT